MSNLKDLCNLYFGTTDLYVLFGIQSDATPEEVKKAYKKLSLRVHPDRVAEKNKEEATEKFKVLGKVHSILSDPEKRAVYDETGVISEDDLGDLQNMDWYSYWRLLFKNVTEEEIKSYEKKYKDSKEEVEDLVKAYNDGKGDMDYILSYVPYSSPNEEPRYKTIILDLIEKGELEKFDAFVNESPRKQEARKRKYEKEAKQAKKVEKENAKKGKSSELVDDDLLKAMILRKQERENQAESFFKHLEEKYSSPKEQKKGRKSKK